MTTLIKFYDYVACDSLATSSLNGGWDLDKFSTISVGDRHFTVAIAGEIEEWQFVQERMLSELEKNNFKFGSVDSLTDEIDCLTGILISSDGDYYEIRGAKGKIHCNLISVNDIRRFGSGAGTFHLFNDLIESSSYDHIDALASKVIYNCNIDRLDYSDKKACLSMALCVRHDLNSDGLMTVYKGALPLCTVDCRELKDIKIGITWSEDDHG